MSPILRLCVAAALLGPVTMVATAAAKDDDPAAKRRLARIEKLRAEGYDHARHRRFKPALKALQQVLALEEFPDETLIFDLGTLADATKDCRSAVIYFQSFLTIAPRDKASKEVKAKLDACLSRLGSLGGLEVNVEPAGARIRVDHAPFGEAPLSGLRLAPGTYSVTVYEPVHQTTHLVVPVAAGAPTKRSVTLRKQIFLGDLKVTAVPAEGVVVYLNNRRVGGVPFETKGLETRRYLVVLEKPGWDRWVRYVRIERGVTALVDAKLEKTGTQVPIPPLPVD